LLILAPLPPYIHALAWGTVFMWLNTFLRGLGLAEIVFRGWAASWWVQTMSLLPVTVGLGLIGFRLIDPALLDAARLQSPDWRWLRTIALHLASPALLAGGGVAFILSLVDYSVPSLFQINVYALEIFAEFSASNQPGRAFLLALPLWALAALVLLTFSPRRLAALTPQWKDDLATPKLHLPGWVHGLQRLALVILFGQFLVPFASQITLVRQWGIFWEAIQGAATEIQTTFWISLGAALTCLPLALYAGIRLINQPKNGLWWGLILFPIALPASLVGIGLVAIWNSPNLPAVYGSIFMPILAALARFTPFAALVVYAQMSTIDQRLIEAAQVFQRNDLSRLIRVQLPLYAPGIAAAACIVFILTAGELGATLIVSPPGRGTLTMRIYNYLHYGASDTVAGLCLAITLTTLVFGGLAALALRLWSRLDSSC